MDYRKFSDGYDTLPTGNVKDAGKPLPDAPEGASRDDYYRDPNHINVSNWVDESKLSTKSKLLAKWIREKMYGIDVREALARFVEQVSSDLYDDKEVAKNLAQLADRLEKEWNATVSGLTQDSEVINARIDSRGVIHTTLKQRIDEEVKLLSPDQEILEIQHNLYRYPSVRCIAWSHGIGAVPLGTEPEGLFGGGNAVSILNKVEYLDRNQLKVYVTKEHSTTKPEITKVDAKTYQVLEGTRSIQIILGE